MSYKGVFNKSATKVFFNKTKTVLDINKILYIHTYLPQTPEIGQGLGRFLSCGARKQEQT